MDSKWSFKGLLNFLSLIIIVCTGLLEYFSHLEILLTWGYLVGIVLTAVSGKKLHAFLALALSLFFIAFALLVFPDVTADLINTRTYSVIGLCVTTFLVLLVIERRTKAEDFKAKITGIFSYGTQGIILTDQAGKIILVNTFIEHLFGYPKEELTGNEIEMVLPGIILASSIKTVSIEPRILDPLIIEHQGLLAFRKDKSTLPVEISLNHFDSNGKLYRVALITDTTVRKQHEELLQAQKKELEAVNKELESFSYSVSHDLRAPLRAVGGYAQMLEEDYAHHFDADGLRILHNIEASAQRMGLLIDDLLSFSRLGRKEIQKRRVNMINLAEAALAEINLTVKHHAEVIIGDLQPVMADPSLMNHVIINLMSNAIKYSAQSKQPRIYIDSKVENDSVIFTIRDNGVGFDMQYAHKLFGVFQRLHTEAEFEGTGVGLAIANRIINKHGGKIWAEAELGIGACFYFSLPVSDQPTVMALSMMEHENN